MTKLLFLFFIVLIGSVSSLRSQHLANVDMNGVTTSQVQKSKRKAAWLTALYLRPAEQSLNRDEQHGPLIPAQMLECVPTLCVETLSGPKTVSQLKKGDILYHIEPTTQRLSPWEVRIVQRKSRRAEGFNSAANDGGFYPLERMIAVER